MVVVKLDDPVFKELKILKRSEFLEIPENYRGPALFNKKIMTAMLPGEGTTLSFENVHFIVVGDKQRLHKFEIWREHRLIGECELTDYAAKKSNCASNAAFCFRRIGKGEQWP